MTDETSTIEPATVDDEQTAREALAAFIAEAKLPAPANVRYWSFKKSPPWLSVWLKSPEDVRVWAGALQRPVDDQPLVTAAPDGERVIRPRASVWPAGSVRIAGIPCDVNICWMGDPAPEKPDLASLRLRLDESITSESGVDPEKAIAVFAGWLRFRGGVEDLAILADELAPRPDGAS